MVNKVKLKKIIHWELYGFIASLLVSISFMELFINLLALSVLVYWYFFRKTDKIFFVPNRFINIGFIGFATVVVLGFLINALPGAEWFENIEKLKWILYIYILSAALNVSDFSKRDLNALAYLVIGVSLYSILISFLGVDLIRPNHEKPMVGSLLRTGGLLASPMTFAQSHGQIFCAFFALCFYQFCKTKKINVLWTIATVLLAIALVLSFTRGVWLALFVSVIVSGFLIHRFWGYAFFASLVSILILAFFLIPNIQERMTQSFDPSRSYDGNRVRLWMVNFSMWKDYPFLGMGYYENYRRLPEYYEKLGHPPGTYIGHAHNQFIHILAGTGILGLGFYLLSVFGIWILGIRFVLQNKHREFNWETALMFSGSMGVLCFFISGLTEANLEDTEVKYVFLLFLSLIIWLSYKPFKSTKTRDGVSS